MNQPLGACEFCRELAPAPDAGADTNLRTPLGARIVLDRHGFVVVPSLGQIVDGSLMLVRKQHVERFADMRAAELDAAAAIVQLLRSRSAHPLILFEHGAKTSTGGSCGIYHAHAHLVPLSINPHALVSQLAHGIPQSASLRLQEDWLRLKPSDEYVLLDNGATRWCLEVNAANRSEFPSQFFRRRLASFFVGVPWDWRGYPQSEPAVVDTYHSWISTLSGVRESASL